MNTNKYVKGLISICCLGYNHEKYIEECITSIWNNENLNIEIIVVDDGSSDCSVSLLNELSVKSPYPMSIIAQSNTGNIARNMNRALKSASGEFVMLMSLDDKFIKNSISECFNVINENECMAFICQSSLVPINSKGEVLENILPSLKILEKASPTIDDLIDTECNEFGAIPVQGTIFRKSILDTVGGYEEFLLGDDIVLRSKVFKHIKENPGLTFSIVHGSNCYYRIHDNNIHKDSIRQMKIVLEVLEHFYEDRENPEILYAWLGHTINSNSFENYVELFTHNKRANALLLDDRVKKMISDNIKTCAYNDLDETYMRHKCIEYMKSKSKMFSFMLFTRRHLKLLLQRK